jgi:hypothetical protein
MWRVLYVEYSLQTCKHIDTVQVTSNVRCQRTKLVLATLIILKLWMYKYKYTYVHL